MGTCAAAAALSRGARTAARRIAAHHRTRAGADRPIDAECLRRIDGWERDGADGWMRLPRSAAGGEWFGRDRHAHAHRLAHPSIRGRTRGRRLLRLLAAAPARVGVRPSVSSAHCGHSNGCGRCAPQRSVPFPLTPFALMPFPLMPFPLMPCSHYLRFPVMPFPLTSFPTYAFPAYAFPAHAFPTYALPTYGLFSLKRLGASGTGRQGRATRLCFAPRPYGDPSPSAGGTAVPMAERRRCERSFATTLHAATGPS